jgi:hypothetical protein
MANTGAEKPESAFSHVITKKKSRKYPDAFQGVLSAFSK